MSDSGPAWARGWGGRAAAAAVGHTWGGSEGADGAAGGGAEEAVG